MGDLASRIADKIQLTTNGYGCYINAVENAFGGAVGFFLLVKVYGDEANA